MKNTLSFTRFVESLGCHLKIGYHWSAISKDEMRVVFTIWDDHLKDNEYVLIPAGSPPWMALPGGRELRRHVPIALKDGVEAIGILCHAENPLASRRVRAYFDEKALLVLKLEQRQDQVIATVVGEVETKNAEKGPVAKQTRSRKSAANDLDDVPEGAQVPERLSALGSVFKRDRMVRDYVIRRANGECEFCGMQGFLMENGRRYLEAHHIIGLGQNGPDTVENVIALCPSHHREAHYGVEAIDINSKMQAKIVSLMKSKRA